MSSIQTTNLHTITTVPLSQIRRPILPVLDHNKIKAMVSTAEGTPMASATCTLEQAQQLKGQLPAIDVLYLKEQDHTYFFAFGGCHRLQAYDALAKQHHNSDYPVPCKLLPATRNQLRLYLGSAIDT
ncbi:hypothetical protein NCAS_0H03330 [Naumovozyma castellii]|uniref:Sulfiredoxin n=1 Tax=Naumovozyma castellii TaxID=27288 RepID=G0VJG4_NAUCA|nr:hypothetical protein NCAS_0H03330 [Naumovozyma castellii CBS 4309]CCC71643.1 hypothetical protein NCAS_0H03330 [Naumovozyma castellii CBS 4309]